MAKYRVQLLNTQREMVINQEVEAKDPQSAIKQIISCDVVPTKSNMMANAKVELLDGSKQSVGYYIYTPKTHSSATKIWIVSVSQPDYEVDEGGKIAGVFSSEQKARQAMGIVKRWLKNEMEDDCEVHCLPTYINQLSWYDIDKLL